MGLELYKLPLGLADGVEIPLPETDVVFTIMLPCNSNEEFSSRLLARLNMTTDDISEDGSPTVNPQDFSDKRQKLFFDTCIIDVRGLPDGISKDEFFKEYPLAAKFLMRKANNLSVKADEEVNKALEKSLPTPNGKSFGVVGTDNTKPLNVTASQ